MEAVEMNTESSFKSSETVDPECPAFPNSSFERRWRHVVASATALLGSTDTNRERHHQSPPIPFHDDLEESNARCAAELHKASGAANRSESRRASFAAAAAAAGRGKMASFALERPTRCGIVSGIYRQSGNFSDRSHHPLVDSIELPPYPVHHPDEKIQIPTSSSSSSRSSCNNVKVVDGSVVVIAPSSGPHNHNQHSRREVQQQQQQPFDNKSNPPTVPSSKQRPRTVAAAGGRGRMDNPLLPLLLSFLSVVSALSVALFLLLTFSFLLDHSELSRFRALLVLPILCPATSIALAFSPLPIVLEALSSGRRDTMPVPLFYSTAFVNVLSVDYGRRMGSIPLLLTNAVSLVAQIFWLACHHHVTNGGLEGGRARRWHRFCLQVGGGVLFLWYTCTLTSIEVVGFLVIASNIVVFATPLIELKNVILSGSTASMPWVISVIMALQNSVWALYGYLIQSQVIFVPAVICFLLAVFQIVVVVSISFQIIDISAFKALFNFQSPKIFTDLQSNFPLRRSSPLFATTTMIEAPGCLPCVAPSSCSNLQPQQQQQQQQPPHVKPCDNNNNSPPSTATTTTNVVVVDSSANTALQSLPALKFVKKGQQSAAV